MRHTLLLIFFLFIFLYRQFLLTIFFYHEKNFIQSYIAFFLYVFAANTGYCEIRIPFNDNWKFQLGDRPNGNIVPTFDGIFDLTAEDCEIIGIDNGNQYDPDGVKYSSFSRGSFHNGKARLYIRHNGSHSGKYSVRNDLTGYFSFNL